MSLNLDKRQRAMLREMGVRVWSPLPQTEADLAPPPASATRASAGGAPPAARELPAGLVRASALAPAAPRPAARPAQAPAQTAAQVPTSTEAAPGQNTATTPAQHWQVGQAVALAGQDDAQAAQGPRWLLLTEHWPEDLGEAADLLLRHMLRAARLHQGAQVWMAPLQRSAGAAEVSGLDAVLGRTEPDVVFVMSRLAAQALLETDQPLGRLRGQVHDLWGVPAVVSYDLGALLRMPQEKAKAWDDLCLALQVAQAQHAERRDAG